jgi:hypothetical protein
MPKKRKSSLSVKHLAEKRRKDRGESSQLSREEDRIRIENFRAEQESEEASEVRRQNDRITRSNRRQRQSRQSTVVPPPPESSQK